MRVARSRNTVLDVGREMARSRLHKRTDRSTADVEQARCCTLEPVFHPSLGIKGLSCFIAGSSGRDSRGAAHDSFEATVVQSGITRYSLRNSISRR